MPEAKNNATDLDLSPFTDEQRSRLLDVRERVKNNKEEMFSEQELRHMRFIQWLIAHGRLSDQ